MQCFIVNNDEIGNRLDPLFYSQDILHFIKKTPFKLYSIAEVTEYLKAGFAAGKSEQSEDETGIIQIRPTNINDCRQLIFNKNIYVKSEIKETKFNYLLKREEVLFNNTNSQELVGKTVYFDLDGEYFCSNHITRIKVKEEILSPIYLTFVLNWLQEKKVFFNTCTNWNNQSGVNIELLKSFKIPVPDLDTQNTIIEILQLASDNREKKRKEAEKLLNSLNDFVLKQLGIILPSEENRMSFCVNAKELENRRIDPLAYQRMPRAILKSINNSSFKKNRLKEIVIESFAGEWGEDTEREKPEYYSLFNVIRNKNFNNIYNIDYDDIVQRYIPNFKKERIELKKGDILIEKSGGSPQQPVGRVALIENPIENYTFSNFLQCLRINKTLCSPLYLFIYLRTIYRLNYMKYIQSQTTGIINLIMEDFLNIPIVLPNMNIQKDIADEYKDRLRQAKQLEKEAKEEVEQAKANIERIILGEVV